MAGPGEGGGGRSEVRGGQRVVWRLLEGAAESLDNEQEKSGGPCSHPRSSKTPEMTNLDGSDWSALSIRGK